MITFLHTGDLHLGRKYTNQEPEIARKYDEARISALQNVLRVAEEKNCQYVVIAGDLFDTKYVPVSLLNQTCALLGECVCPVVVLPGNHDFYEGKDDKLWNKFVELAPENVTLLTANIPVPMEGVVFYPCVCHDKHSEENVIGWVKAEKYRDPEMVNIGLAHGAIEGLSYDKEKKYYYMTKAELGQSNVDLWMIGHTHIPFPDKEKITGQKFFNAGTHQQTDIADNSEGSVFVITVDDKKTITAEKVHTGVLRFCRKNLALKHGQSLRNEIRKCLSDLVPSKTSVRLVISGVALAEDYDTREELYDEFRDQFVKFEALDADLQPEITEEMIDSETVEGSIENKLLRQYVDEPDVLNLAFELIKSCKED